MKINPIFISNTNTQNTENLKKTGNIPAFGKKLLEKTRVRKPWGETVRAKFVEYDPKNKKDRKLIYELNHKHWGRTAKYIDNISYSFDRMTKGGAPEKPIKQQYFGLEDKYSHTLAIAQVQSSDKILRLGDMFFPNATKIVYIQTKPSEIFTSDKRQYEGLGEVLVSRIVKRAKEEGRDSVILYSTNHNFWNNSGFFKIPEQAKKHRVDVMQLKSEDFDNYIKFVENKTNFENPYLDIYA